jgi:hypothetical protein
VSSGGNGGADGWGTVRLCCVTARYFTRGEHVATGESRKKELRMLFMRCGIAGDTYYADMSDAVFAEVMRNFGLDHNDPLYRAYAGQRAAGAEEFARAVSDELQSVVSPEELHLLALAHNFDSGMWLPCELVAHPCCDAATALLLYWSLQPDYIYTRYGSPAEVPADDFLAGAARVLHSIEERIQAGTFAAVLPRPDLGDFGQGGHNYAFPPLSGIPAALRI